MRKFSLMAVAASSGAMAIAAIATPAFAQSSGAVEFENAITVTGRANKGVAGVDVPETPKAKQVLNAELIQTQTPGQSINETINLIPGVSFANQDPFGSQGGTLYIRGFDSSRISETFDGIPLNDTGNYALYSNQMLDPELIDTVSVNLGTTDVDSPTASATGSTVNYRSRNPTEDFHVRMQGSVGSFNFQRIFGVIDTGNITSGGLRAWLAASSATNDVWYGGVGKINKKEYNFKIYQPLGSNGDFITLGGHWNKNRNFASTSMPLRTEATSGLTVGSGSGNRYPTNFSEAYYTATACTAGTTGASCYERRYNPSDTANLRANSRFTLSDHMVLNVDPYLEYSKANGGGSAYQVNEGTTNGGTGYSGSAVYLGYDYNKNGTVDTTGTYLYSPSMTQTYRFGVLASLRYEFNPAQVIRLAYTYDRGRHKQTGEMSSYNADGTGSAYFPSDNPVRDVNGVPIEKRNRLSYAILHQVSGEYSGKFLNDALNVVVGIRMPFFKRNLTNFCITTTATASYACYNSAATTAAVLALPASIAAGYGAPQQKIFTFNAPLPSAGITLKVAPSASIYANYSRTLQVPGTDTLYNTFYAGKTIGAPRKEMGNNFDLGLRYKSSRVVAQVGGWYTILSNRITSAFDPDANASIYTNLGRVDRYGIDGSASFKINQQLSAYVFGSWLHSKIRDNVLATATTYYQTAGKFESGLPEFMVGGRLDGHFGPVDLGLQAKYTGSRWENDQNLAQVATVNGVANTEINGAKLKAFTVVDLNARVKLGWLGLNDKTFLQLNVTNLLNDYHVASLASSTGYTNNNLGYVYMGSPRTFIGTINMAF